MAEGNTQYTLNDLYLIAEYQIRGMKSFPTIIIGDTTFIVPYKYSEKAQNTKEAAQKFKADLLDFQTVEEKKYQSHNEAAFKVELNGTEYVLPYDNQQIEFPLLVKKVNQKALEKYNTAIETHRRIKETRPIEFSSAAIKKYKYQLKINSQHDPKETDMMEVLEFLGNSGKATVLATGKVIRSGYKGGKRATKIANKLANYGYKRLKQSQTFHSFKTTGKKLIKSLVKKIISGKEKTLPTTYKAGILAVLMWGGNDSYLKQCTSNFSIISVSQQEPTYMIYTPQVPQGETQDTYIDFMGKVHEDKYGNLKEIRKIRPHIMTIILALEGYAEKSYNDKPDGTGIETVGSGATVIIDEKGNERPVTKGEKISLQQNSNNCFRYIDKHLLNVLGDSIGRSLSDREICTIIGAGYCWGAAGIQNSEFLQSIKCNESLTTQIRKLTGFRTPKGLLKRSALLAEYLSGNWTSQDLLDLPIYRYKDKGYVNCAIYNKELSYYLPCQKDEKGNDIPIICDDNFCKKYYMDYNHQMLKRLKKTHFFDSYKTIRELLPQDYTNYLICFQKFPSEKISPKAIQKDTLSR